MWDCFTKNVQQVLIRAQVEAQKMGSEYIGSEHLVLGTLANRRNTACRKLKILGVDLNDLKQRINDRAKKSESKGFTDFPFSARATRVLEISFAITQNLEKPLIGTEEILLGVLREGNGFTARILIDEFGISFSTVLEELYDIDHLDLSNFMESRRIVQEGLRQLEERHIVSTIHEKFFQGKIGEISAQLEYIIELLDSMDRKDLKEEAVNLKEKVSMISKEVAAQVGAEEADLKTRPHMPRDPSGVKPPAATGVPGGACITSQGTSTGRGQGITITINVDRSSLEEILARAMREVLSDNPTSGPENFQRRPKQI